MGGRTHAVYKLNNLFRMCKATPDTIMTKILNDSSIAQLTSMSETCRAAQENFESNTKVICLEVMFPIGGLKVFTDMEEFCRVHANSEKDKCAVLAHKRMLPIIEMCFVSQYAEGNGELQWKRYTKDLDDAFQL